MEIDHVVPAARSRKQAEQALSEYWLALARGGRFHVEGGLVSIPVALVSGLHPGARTATVDRLLRRHPGAVAIHHDLRHGGTARIQRVIRDVSGVLDLTEVCPERGCVACAVREDGDAEDVELSTAVLEHLAPYTPIVNGPEVTGGALCVRELAERVAPATAQLPADAQTGEVTTVVWRRLRPLHPSRLFDAMDELVTTTVRSRGRFWLANRHQRMLAWDAAAGAVSVEDAGPWLATLPEAAWDLITPARRAAAALDWNPIVGDRVQHLVFIGPDLDRDHIVSLLDSCLIDHDDALPGAAEWAGHDDPFAPLLDVKETA
ncbi:GTP-binding protein [Nonomuraea fuscirosea]|uniref:GTP-binding protein n=1 Tax=Nonomuraea fuscirosea TaxID=1291556 RepID=UPI003433FF77